MPHRKPTHTALHCAGPFIVPVSKPKTLGLAALELTLTALCLWAGFAPAARASTPQDGRWLALTIAAVTVLGTVRFLMFLVSTAPMLVVSHEGIRFDPGTTGDYTLPWKQIKSLGPQATWIFSGLQLTVADASAFIEHQTPLQRRLCRVLHPGLRRSGTLYILDMVLPISSRAIMSRLCTDFRPHMAHRCIGRYAR